ncbi:Sterol O-acyltransferase 2 [Colletotrichum fructicola]|nr:Sterol O-acyltransferase 2 [Colletotrichum fructicola]KAE9566843.1 Sterol O-acyltransferase 2 [Colletotrichum fructicola]KAF4411219.1 Sterol O-acyltransferase 2 [Colletotrichum fructicola]KAF4883777.1 Sterol O-acyltransferase 2 [Colletotrichum fructicola]KAF5486266.1 Sterol O-acyltransferase 2 [Colletotrichum fructicola]
MAARPVASRESPRALRDALRTANGGRTNSTTPSETTSEEDYDEPKLTRRRHDRPAAKNTSSPLKNSSNHERKLSLDGSTLSEASSIDESTGGADRKDLKTYVLSADDRELRDVIRRGLEREKDPKRPRRPGKFSDLVFTRQFSAFDRQNQQTANSPFHGFFTLFWLAVALFVVKIGAANWRATGNPLGTNEIMKTMFRRDVIVLLASDGVMCGITGVGWILQRLIFSGYLDWNRSGWIIQNVWQSIFIGSVVGLTLIRDWPWTHTVFFVLHGIVMLMKQHSYAFYNGHLSTVYKKRKYLLSKLKKLEHVAPINSPSTTSPSASTISVSHLDNPPSAAEMKGRRHSVTHTRGSETTDVDRISHAIESGEPLDADQVRVFERIIKWEIDGLTDELRGKATSVARAYPNNLTLANHYEYIVLPTVVYELEYPRSDSIDWYYVAEKTAATFGIILVMIMVSQAFIYPVVMQTVAMKETGMPLAERFRYFPWMLSDLIFPFMMEYMMAWYLIWETILNTLAELTYFADRSFYDAWWNSVSWDQFARDWNRPVHNFLLRHVYHSSISSMKVNRHTATLITFFLSACVHELVMWCLFKKLRGYLLFLQMCQLPLVQLSRTSWMRGRKTLGNIMFWFGIFTGPSLLCSLYLIL